MRRDYFRWSDVKPLDASASPAAYVGYVYCMDDRAKTCKDLEQIIRKANLVIILVDDKKVGLGSDMQELIADALAYCASDPHWGLN